MKKVKTSQVILFASSVLFFGACAAMKGNRQQKSKNAATEVKHIQGVKDAVGLAKVAQDLKCDRGIFIVDVIKDYVAGGRAGNILQIYGSGVVTDKPVKDFNPYAYLNYVPRDPEQKLDSKAIVSITNDIPVEFGNESVNSDAYTEGESMTNRNVVRMAMTTTDPETKKPVTPPHTVYFAHKNPTDKTYHISSTIGGVPVTRTDDQVHAVKGKAEDGVADLKSFNIEINKHFFAVTIPTDIEAESGLDAGVEGKMGKATKIKINARPPLPPAPVKSNFITVAMDDRTKAKPAWRDIFRTADKGQDSLEVPTEWAGGSMKDGVIGVEIKRSYVYAFPYPDAKGGNLCIEAGAGVRTTGSIAKADPAPEKK